MGSQSKLKLSLMHKGCRRSLGATGIIYKSSFFLSEMYVDCHFTEIKQNHDSLTSTLCNSLESKFGIQIHSEGEASAAKQKIRQNVIWTEQKTSL